MLQNQFKVLALCAAISFSQVLLGHGDPKNSCLNEVAQIPDEMPITELELEKWQGKIPFVLKIWRPKMSWAHASELLYALSQSGHFEGQLVFKKLLRDSGPEDLTLKFSLLITNVTDLKNLIELLRVGRTDVSDRVKALAPHSSFLISIQPTLPLLIGPEPSDQIAP